MFEKFSKDARSAIVHAQEQARMMREPMIEPAHLVMGLALTESTARELLDQWDASATELRERYARQPRADALDSEALAELGIDVAQVRERVESTFGQGALDASPKQWRAGHIPFSPSAKKSLELTLREAQALEHKEISSGHMLLGTISADPETLAVLIGSAAQVEQLREETVRRLGERAA
jgi:ATP-dependent Clp protease ATP-binding subunit ClpA